MAFKHGSAFIIRGNGTKWSFHLYSETAEKNGLKDGIIFEQKDMKSEEQCRERISYLKKSGNIMTFPIRTESSSVRTFPQDEALQPINYFRHPDEAA